MAVSSYRDIQRFVLVSDLDGTLIDHEHVGPEADPKLVAFALSLEEAGDRLTLWFNSSRPSASQRESLERVPGLPVPRYQIGAMGTQVADGATGELIADYGREQFGDWPREEVERICVETFGLVPHAAEMQTAYKASFDLPDPQMAKAIESELRGKGIDAKIVVSSGRDLDVLPPAAGKASAIRWLVKHENLAPESIVVSGDSANDLDMFDKPFRGIVVGNGHEELRRQAPARAGDCYLAKGLVAAGVLEGLRHFDVLPDA
ncbi:MAG: HAD-IIB family hydrolase [Planctomycetota bacterium]